MNILKQILPSPVKKTGIKALKALRFYLTRKDFELNLRRATPVFVYQMGKVASKSVHSSLLEQYPGVVIHGHRFAANDENLQ